MRVALYESFIYWEDKKRNIEKAEKTFEKIKDKEIDVVLLPEMSFTGFSMDVEKTKEKNNETIDLVMEWTRKYSFAIGFGYVKSGGVKCENHYAIIKNGELLADYIKIHPFSFSGEDKYFQGGFELSTCKLNDVEIGIQICYDLRFPEVFQQLSKRTSLIVIPANWPQSRREHWNILLQARAIENQVYIAGVNCIGQIGAHDYSGDSKLISPNGDVCTPKEIVHNEKDQIYIYDLKNDVEKYRIGFPMKQDRKENLYIKLLQNK